MRAVRRAGTAATLALAGALLAGCGGGVAPAPPPAPTVAPPVAPAAEADAVACQRHGPASESVRRVAGAIQAGPVLPAGVALFLIGPREAYTMQGVRDVELAAAMAEVVAAIDELDAQGKALLPAGGDAANDKVQLDATRVVAALDAVERACATR